MKTTRKLAKVLCLVLCVAILTLAFASCGKDKNVVISYETELGTFTLSEADYALLMTIVKQNFFSQYLYGGTYLGSYYGISDTAAFWDKKADDGQTYDQLYTNNALEIAKSIVIEQYYMKKYNLTLDDLAKYPSEIKDGDGNLVYKNLKEEYDANVAAIKETVKSLGGTGAYKRYYGYMPADLERYYTYNYTSKLVMNHLYTNVHPVTDEQLDEYYKENYKQYIVILINKEQDIKYEMKDGEYVLDDNGNKKPYYVVYDKDGKKQYVTDISKEYLEEKEYTLAYSYQYEDIKETDRKDEKKAISEEIFAQLKNGVAFEELAAKYSDEMLTHYYKDGYMIAGDLINDDVAIEALKDLKPGEYTEKSFTIESKFEYIVKRVELTEKAYTHADEDAEDKTYADLFEGYADIVETNAYSELLEEIAKDARVDTSITSKYTMKGTFLSKMFG